MTLTWSNETHRSWRQSPIWLTLVLSLVIHGLGLWLWTAVPNLFLRYRDQLPDWLRWALSSEQVLIHPPELLKSEFRPRPDEYEIPLSFIEVDPALAVTEPPKDAQFQSTANTLAQNVTAPKPELNQPFIGGTQEKFPKLLDVDQPPLKAEAAPKDPAKVELADTDREAQEPKPTVPEPEPPKLVLPEPKPVAKVEPEKTIPEKPPVTPPKGELELAMVKAAPVTPPRSPTPPSKPREEPPTQVPQEEQKEQKPTRRKSLKNLAQARQAKGVLVGDLMKQDGGVDRRGLPSMPVKRGPMGDYGARMWAAVQERWYGTLETQKFAGEFRGKVTVDFKLHPDGNVTEVEVKDDSADDGIYSMYCVAAIQLSASFGTWSNEMRTTYGPKPIECQCVFWY